MNATTNMQEYEFVYSVKEIRRVCEMVETILDLQTLAFEGVHEKLAFSNSEYNLLMLSAWSAGKMALQHLETISGEAGAIERMHREGVVIVRPADGSVGGAT